MCVNNAPLMGLHRRSLCLGALARYTCYSSSTGLVGLQRARFPFVAALVLSAGAPPATGRLLAFAPSLASFPAHCLGAAAGLSGVPSSTWDGGLWASGLETSCFPCSALSLGGSCLALSCCCFLGAFVQVCRLLRVNNATPAGCGCAAFPSAAAPPLRMLAVAWARLTL